MRDSRPGCPAVPQPGTIFTRTGVKSLDDAAPADHPLIGWCQPCGLPLTRSPGEDGWRHRGASAFWSVRQAGARWDWQTFGIDPGALYEGLCLARCEARLMAMGDAHGAPWVVELTEAGTRAEWARFHGSEETTRERGARR
jgi:hypothetical protein